MKLATTLFLLLAGTGLAGTAIFLLQLADAVFDILDYCLIFSMIALAAACVLSFMTSVAARQVLTLCILSAAAAAVASEIAIVAQKPPPVAESGQVADSARERLLALKSGGEIAYVSLLHADITRPDASGRLHSVLKIADMPVLPLSGVANVTTLLCNETDRWVRYQSDRFGFRNPPSSWSGAVDMAVVGDSYTQGNCVDDGNSYADLLRRTYPKLVNLGQRGNGPFAILASIREYLRERRPNITIWFHYEGNDLPSDIQRELNTPLFKQYLDANFTQHLRERAPQVSEAFAHYIDRKIEEPPENVAPGAMLKVSWVDALRSRLFLYQIRSRLGFANFPSRFHTDNFLDVLTVAKAQVAKWDGRLLLVYLPAKRRYVSVGGRRTLDRYRKTVIAITRTLDIPVLDLTDAFAAAPYPQSLFREHFTEQGHAIVAREVAKFVQRQGLRR